MKKMTLVLFLIMSAAIVPIDAFGQADATIGNVSINAFLENLAERTIPFSTAIHILLFAMPIFLKIFYSLFLAFITLGLWFYQLVPLVRSALEKISAISLVLTIAGLAVAILIQAITKDFALSLSGVAVGLMSSFIGYTFETSLEDLIPQEDGI